MIKFTQLSSLLTLLLILFRSANHGAAFDRPLEPVPKKLLAVSGSGMLQLFAFECILFDQMVPFDRDAR
jgi:hypothetical protein